MAQEKIVLYDKCMQVLKSIQFLALFFACVCLSLSLPVNLKKDLFTTGQCASYEADQKDHNESIQPLIDVLLAQPVNVVVECESTEYFQTTAPLFAGYLSRHCYYHLCDIPPPQFIS